MAMDLTTPINITAVIGAVKAHKDLLVTLDSEAASDILKHFTAVPGVKDSLTLGRTSLGSISHKYTGQFLGQISAGEIKPRTLKVYPAVMEMSDEPERYRRSYIVDVKGGLWPKQHPFEIWLNNYGVKCASQELHDCLLTAKYDASASKTSLADAFDGPLTIIENEKTAGNIATANGNMIATAAFTRANIGDELLAMWRKAPNTLRNQPVKMFISYDLGDLYDDWLDDQGTLVTGSGAETADQQYLRNTNRKVELVRLPMPEGSQFVMITKQENVLWGYDSDSDMNQLKPFDGANPYLYQAAGKYVIGFQFVSIDKSMLIVNDKPVTPEG